MNDCTLVVGLDAAHLAQLAATWPTWQRNKPELMDLPMLFFHDESVTCEDIMQVIGYQPNLQTVPYFARWGDQRERMLSGFVHVPARSCRTNYMLKLDTDVVALPGHYPLSGFNLRRRPAIVGHRWKYTIPADQMLVLDRWVESNPEYTRPLSNYLPLDLVPENGSARLYHDRIASYCALFDLELVRIAADCADRTAERPGRLPVPSQDGYLWYCAARMGMDIQRLNMKEFGMVSVASDRKRQPFIQVAMGHDGSTL